MAPLTTTESFVAPTEATEIISTTNNVETTLEAETYEMISSPSASITETTTLESLPYPENIPSKDITTITTVEGTERIDSNDNEIIPENKATKRNARLQNTKTKDIVELNLFHKNDHKNHRRKTRSLVDYIIARYYDDHYVPPHVAGTYTPQEQLGFLVRGKFREYQINFMKYDTVLPFYYVPHLDSMALRFPLDNVHYYLLLLLPVDNSGVDQLICDLRLNESLKYIIDNMRYKRVIATIPSFKLKGYVNLTPSLQKVIIMYLYDINNVLSFSHVMKL